MVNIHKAQFTNHFISFQMEILQAVTQGGSKMNEDVAFLL
jgi:hypothetical protein